MLGQCFLCGSCDFLCGGARPPGTTTTVVLIPFEHDKDRRDLFHAIGGWTHVFPAARPFSWCRRSLLRSRHFPLLPTAMVLFAQEGGRVVDDETR
jgi:hypothetical protein